MFENIEVYAGPNAMKQIWDGGLKPEMVRAMAGAAGGPKFLVLAGLDRALFGNFFKNRKEPLFYAGSSIGIFRAAALAQKDPVNAHMKFTDAYLRQSYSGKPSPAEISSETEKILDSYLQKDDIEYILNRSYMHISIIATRCTGLSSMDNRLMLGASLLAAYTANYISRNLLLKIYDRVMFHDPGINPPFAGHVKNRKFRIDLTPDNFRQAVLASGSIPMAMKGVKNIPGAPSGTYRDGGVCDYHMDMDFGLKEGIVLFPHFFSSATPGWLDKSLKRRKANPENFSNTLLVCPSEKFVRSLPLGRVTDRTDFVTFAGRDSERIECWEKVVRQSDNCGEDFLEAAASGKLKNIIRPFRA